MLVQQAQIVGSTAHAAPLYPTCQSAHVGERFGPVVLQAWKKGGKYRGSGGEREWQGLGGSCNGAVAVQGEMSGE